MNIIAAILTYEEREKYACDVYGNIPDENGEIQHGKGCYTQSEFDLRGITKLTAKQMDNGRMFSPSLPEEVGE